MPENEQQTDLTQIKQAQANTHKYLDATRRAEDNLYKLYQTNENPYDQDIEAALGDDAYGFFKQHGDVNDRKATAFGIGYLGGRLTSGQRAVVEDYIRSRREQDRLEDNALLNEERAAYEDNYRFNYGDRPIHITKDISDKIKNLSSDYAMYKEQYDKDMEDYNKILGASEQAERVGQRVNVGEAPTDSTLDKRKEVVSEIRRQLNAAGFDIGEAPEGGEYDTVEGLLDSLDYATESAVRKALGLATTRTEYVQRDTRTLEEKLRERMAREAEVELRNQQRELERTKNRQSIAGLAATIGEMVRASQGATVNPRDWSQIYNNLTAQAKANVDNYKVRMQKLRDDARAERIAARNAKIEADEKERQRQHQLNLKEIEYGWKGDQKEKDRELKYLMQLLKEKKDRYIADLRWGDKGFDPSKSTITVFGNEAWSLPKGETFKNFVYGVIDTLNASSSYKDPENARRISILKDQRLSTDPYGYYNRNVETALNNWWDELTPAAQNKIRNLAKKHMGEKLEIEDYQTSTENRGYNPDEENL